MFNQKENGLLTDLKSEEQLCIEKYTKYENNAVMPELKAIMSAIKQQEQTHLQTICSIINGENVSTGGSQNKQAKPQASAAAGYTCGSPDFCNDKYICSDCLATEKHVSSLYDTCIFEFKDTAVRNALNHIQKEEQEHGEQVYAYMSQNGMYG